MLYLSRIIVCSREIAPILSFGAKVVFRMKGNKTQNKNGLQINEFAAAGVGGGAWCVLYADCVALIEAEKRYGDIAPHLASIHVC